MLDAGSPVRSSFDELAKNILAMERPVKSVVVTGPEPGDGCSSICLGLGAALAGMGRRAAVVDGNLDAPSLHRMLGEPNFVGLTSAVEGGRDLEELGFEVAPGLLLVTSGPVPPDPGSYLVSRWLVEAVRSLERGRDLVILDAPVAPVVLGAPALAKGFDGVMLVIHATRTSKSVAREVTDDLLGADVNLLGVVLNGWGEA